MKAKLIVICRLFIRHFLFRQFVLSALKWRCSLDVFRYIWGRLQTCLELPEGGSCVFATPRQNAPVPSVLAD